MTIYVMVSILWLQTAPTPRFFGALFQTEAQCAEAVDVMRKMAAEQHPDASYQAFCYEVSKKAPKA